MAKICMAKAENNGVIGESVMKENQRNQWRNGVISNVAAGGG